MGTIQICDYCKEQLFDDDTLDVKLAEDEYEVCLECFVSLQEIFQGSRTVESPKAQGPITPTIPPRILPPNARFEAEVRERSGEVFANSNAVKLEEGLFKIPSQPAKHVAVDECPHTFKSYRGGNPVCTDAPTNTHGLDIDVRNFKGCGKILTEDEL